MRQRNTCSSTLSKELSEEYKTRSMGVKKGDAVSIMRGNFRGVEGKVTKVNRENNCIYIEGVTREKAGGDTVFAPIHPSNVMISKLNLEDKRRKEILERRASTTIPGTKIEESLKRDLKDVEENPPPKRSIEPVKRRKKRV
jgi:large subunit ribosomal protein L24